MTETGKQLARCPCGEMPGNILVKDFMGSSGHGYAFGDCCSRWHVGFYAELMAKDEPYDLTKDAIYAWNMAVKMNEKWPNPKELI